MGAKDAVETAAAYSVRMRLRSCDFPSYHLTFVCSRRKCSQRLHFWPQLAAACVHLGEAINANMRTRQALAEAEAAKRDLEVIFPILHVLVLFCTQTDDLLLR